MTRKKLTKKQEIFSLIGVVLLVLVAVKFLYPKLTSFEGGHTVELGEYGFFPEEITIRKGETVTFRTTRNEPFWPASNSHPVHDLYPEFDPKRALRPGETWSFTFDKVGEWGYHDHLGSYYSTDVGMIRVVDTTSEIETTSYTPHTSEIQNCVEAESKRKCWVNNLKTTMAKDGLKEAFQLAAEYYKVDEEFARNCNDITHYMGGFAYRLFRDDKESVVIPESTYCALGFYHGFLEVWFHNYPKIEETISFCSHVEDVLGESQPLAIGNCYHGVGHGAYHMYHISDWDNFAKGMEPVFDICEGTGEQIWNCLDGAFNAVNMDYYQSRYEHLEIKENPFRFCEELPKYKLQCYDGLASTLVWGGGGRLDEALTYLEGVPGIENKIAVLRTLVQVEGFSNTTSSDHSTVIRACRRLESELWETCIGAYAQGLMEQGEPGKEEVVGFAFCNAKEFTKEERGDCLGLVEDFSQTYFRKNDTN